MKGMRFRMQTEKKYIQKKRKMKYFIDATIELLEDKEEKPITIRNIASIAGFNSATLYNYFDNLDHLLYYSNLRHLFSFINELKQEDLSNEDIKIKIKNSWINLSKLCYLKSEIIYNLIFSDYAKDFDVILNNFLQIYEEDYKESEIKGVKNLFKKSFLNVVFEPIDLFSEEKKLSKNERNEMKDLIITYLQGALARQENSNYKMEYDSFINHMNIYMEYMLSVYDYSMDKK